MTDKLNDEHDHTQSEEEEDVEEIVVVTLEDEIAMLMDVLDIPEEEARYIVRTNLAGAANDSMELAERQKQEQEEAEHELPAMSQAA